jgi:hypothetical protein
MRAALTTAFIIACGSAANRTEAIYIPKPRGSIDLGENLNARHCSELTQDFRDAHSLKAVVETIRALVVPTDAMPALWIDDGLATSKVASSRSLGVSVFWYYGDWTLAVVLDQSKCKRDGCPVEISLIKYNGAKTPAERSSKLCFERWIGTFEQHSRVPR